MTQFSTGNHVALLRNGAEYFPALESAINSAHHEIYVQTYIFELDDIGLRIGKALNRAASRGVSVYLLLDGFGCKDLSKDYVMALRMAGVEVLFFRPKISPWTLKRTRLRRMHRKMIVVDGYVAFVGGINIIDDFNTPFSTSSPRVDYAVKVEGSLLPSMRESMRMLWQRTCQMQLKAVRVSKLGRGLTHKATGDMRAAFLKRDNVKHRRDIEKAYLLAIQSAKSEILIANAYFLPGLHFRHALRDAAARGVRVTVLLQKQVEYLLLDLATHALYTSLLSQGIEIYEYHKSFMHSKVAVIDCRLAIVGSSNIDPFSLLMSLEANIAVDDDGFAEKLRAGLQQSINTGASLVTAEAWGRHNYIRRFVSWLAYGLIRLMVGIIGYSESNE